MNIEIMHAIITFLLIGLCGGFWYIGYKVFVSGGVDYDGVSLFLIAWFVGCMTLATYTLCILIDIQIAQYLTMFRSSNG